MKMSDKHTFHPNRSYNKQEIKIPGKSQMANFPEWRKTQSLSDA
jgi:hypothetical protein